MFNLFSVFDGLLALIFNVLDQFGLFFQTVFTG